MAYTDYLNEVQKLFIAYYQRPADAGGLKYWAEQLDANGGDLSSIIDAFASSEESQSLYGDKSLEDLITEVYVSAFNRKPESDGLEFYVEKVNSGEYTVGTVVLNILNGAQNEDAEILENKIKASMEFTKILDPDLDGQDIQATYAGESDAQVARDFLKTVTTEDTIPSESDLVELIKTKIADPGDPILGGDGSSDNSNDNATVEKFYLSMDQDNIVGTDGDDLFIAREFDGKSTAQSGDYIDGKGGYDTLTIDDTVGAAGAVITTLVTENVEKFVVRAQSDRGTTGENDLGSQSTFDAERMDGVTWYETNNSRADVVIEDVRIQDNQITKDVTISMVQTDPGDVDMAVYFDPESLRAEAPKKTNELILKLIDIESASKGESPLDNSPYSGFSFRMDSKEYNIESSDIQNAKTYEDLLVAITNAISENPELSSLEVALGDDFTVVNPENDQEKATGKTIVIKSTDKGVLEAIQLLTEGSVPAKSSFYNSFTDSTPETESHLVESTVVLDDVGRHGDGGDLIIGSMDLGKDDYKSGVEKFNITVERDSNLESISSTNNALKEIVIVNGDNNKGSLTVGASQQENVDLNDITQRDDHIDGIEDIRVLDASGMTGNLKIQATLSGNIVDKYTNVSDTAADHTDDDVNFNYTLGDGDDTLCLSIDGSNLEKFGTVTREDFILNINSGNGNDHVVTNIADMTAAGYANSKDNTTMVVNTGSGNDIIETQGSGDAHIYAGAGDDTVYTDNSGDKAKWVVNSYTTNDLDSVNLESKVLLGAKLRVTFAGADGVMSGAADSFINGYESTVEIPMSANKVTASQAEINQAIKDAINNDPVLSKLVAATDGPAYTVVLDSKIDGAFTADDFQFEIIPVDYEKLSSSDQKLLNDYWHHINDTSTDITQADIDNEANAFFADSGEDVKLINSGSEAGGLGSDNIIHLDAGNDVLVLSTNNESAETIVLNGQSLGVETIVNFDGNDKVDVSYHLTNHVKDANKLNDMKAATSSYYTVTNGGVNVDANDVVVINGFMPNSDPDKNEDFAHLNQTNIVNALKNNGESFGSLSDNTVDFDYMSDLVEASQKVVVFVEDGKNLGDYKVFELTVKNDDGATDVVSAIQFAELDFGHTIDDDNLQGIANNTDGQSGDNQDTGDDNTDDRDETATRTENITEANDGESDDASDADVTYTFENGDYTYTVENFDSGDVLDLPDNNDPSLSNTDYTDGQVEITYTEDGNNVVKVIVTGLGDNDSHINSIDDFNAVYGEGSIQ